MNNQRIQIGYLEASNRVSAPNLVYNTGNQTISGNKTFANNINVSGSGIFNALDLNNIDNLSLSGVDITITNGIVTLTNPVSAPNLVYNIGDQTISGVKTFATGINIVYGSNPQFIKVFNATGLNSGEFGLFGWSNNQLVIGPQRSQSGILRDVMITGKNINFQSSGGNINFSSVPKVNGSGILLTGQNSFVLQGGSTQGSLSLGPNYVGLAGSNIGYSTNINSRRIPILENCVAKRVSITLQQATLQVPIMSITGSLINISQNLTGIISTGMLTTSDDNFYSFTNNNLNVPFSIGDSGVVLIHATGAISQIRTMASVYFYN